MQITFCINPLYKEILYKNILDFEIIQEFRSYTTILKCPNSSLYKVSV